MHRQANKNATTRLRAKDEDNYRHLIIYSTKRANEVTQYVSEYQVTYLQTNRVSVVSISVGVVYKSAHTLVSG